MNKRSLIASFGVLSILITANNCFAQSALSPEEAALLAEEAKIIQQAAKNAEVSAQANKEQKQITESVQPLPTIVATPIKVIKNIVSTPVPTIAPTLVPTTIPTAFQTSVPTTSPTTKPLIKNDIPETKNTIEPTSKSVTKETEESQELETAKNKITSLTAELEETKSRLLIAETQVARLQKFLDEKSSNDVSNLANKNRISPPKMSPPLKVIRKEPTEQEIDREVVEALKQQENLVPAQKVDAEQELPIATINISGTAGRTGPARSESIITTLEEGVRVPVETRQGEWIRVITPTGVRVWVPESSVTFNRGAVAVTRKTKPTVKDTSNDPLENTMEDNSLDNADFMDRTSFDDSSKTTIEPPKPTPVPTFKVITKVAPKPTPVVNIKEYEKKALEKKGSGLPSSAFSID